MNIEIRQAKEQDYLGIKKLLVGEGNIIIPTWEEIKNISLVAIVDNKIVGLIFANSGNCASAHIDYLIVEKEHRFKNKKIGRSEIGIRLAIEMFEILINKGVTTINAALHDDKIGRILAGLYQEIGFEIIPCYGTLRGSASLVKERLKKKGL